MGDIVKTKDRQFAEMFLNYLSPAFLARPEDETAIQSYLDNEDYKTINYFQLFLKRQMHLIQGHKRGSALCKNDPFA